MSITGPLRHLVLSLVVVAALTGACFVRQRLVGARALAACDAALQGGDAFGAIASARAAAEAYFPGNSYSSEGYARLHRMTQDAETRGDHATALAVTRAIQAAHASTHPTLAADSALAGLPPFRAVLVFALAACACAALFIARMTRPSAFDSVRKVACSVAVAALFGLLWVFGG